MRNNNRKLWRPSAAARVFLFSLCVYEIDILSGFADEDPIQRETDLQGIVDPFGIK